MLLQPSEPRGRRSPRFDRADARRSWIEVRLRGMTANHLQAEVSALSAQLAEVKRLVVELPDADEQLTKRLHALEETVAALCRTTGTSTP